MFKILKFTCYSLLAPSLILFSCKNTTFNLDKSSILSVDNKTPKFQWGVSTSGVQSEGYDNTSIWHNWDISGKTQDHNIKGVDFFNRYKEDIQLAKDMGCNSFRFSIEWSRIEPKKGVFDQTAVNFYRNILNTLKEKDMVPLVTLVHFNYPQWVVDEGVNKKGIEDPKFIDYYLNYVSFIVKEFKNDVKFWLTFNEPNIWITGSYLSGQFPPGKKNPVSTINATWNLLKAHSMAYDLIHGIEPDAMVSSNVFYVLPKPFGHTSDPNGVSKNTLDEKNIQDTDWFFESIANGKTSIDNSINNDKNFETKASLESKILQQEIQEYESKKGIKSYKSENTIQSGSVKANMDSQVGWLKKFDYVAFDYYYRFRNLNQVLNVSKSWLMEIYPEGLYDAVMYYYHKYNKPIIIAENGIGFENNKSRPDGWTRSSALVQHIKQLKRAMSDGANVLGYYHWSITDNYELGSYTPRFGLYTVNVANDPEMKRIKTPAVDVYKEIIKLDGVSDLLLEEYKSPKQ